MAAPSSFCAVLLVLLSLAGKGLCEETNDVQCSLDNINIGTVRTGVMIKGKPQWNVTFINNCKCRVSKIVLKCEGFQSTEPVDPNIFLKQGNKCLLIKGQPLEGFLAVRFFYAWDPPFIFRAASADIRAC